MNVLVMKTKKSLKKVCVFHELENKIELGVWEALYALRRLSGVPGGKALKNITLCSLQLV